MHGIPSAYNGHISLLLLNVEATRKETIKKINHFIVTFVNQDIIYYSNKWTQLKLLDADSNVAPYETII